MDTKDLIKRSALEKLDFVVRQAIEKYEKAGFEEFYGAISLPSSMSDEEKKEIESVYYDLTSSLEGFIMYCKNRSIDISKTLIVKQ